MKQEEFNRIQEFCKQEGFKIESYCGGKTVIIGKKDPWDGVEFVYSDLSGKIYPINKVMDLGFYKPSDYKGYTSSTESEYFQQLKKEAFERFGEIKEGDRFQRDFLSDPNPKIGVVESGYEWTYYKNTDNLNYGGICIYESGKWATKLQEMVEVEVRNRSWRNNSNNGYDFEFHFNVVNGGQNASMPDCARFLAKQLEKYLNQKPESNWCQGCNQVFSDALVDGLCSYCKLKQ